MIAYFTRIPACTLLLLFVPALALAETPSTPDEWQAHLVVDRQQAEALIEQGEPTSAAQALARTWRSLPADYPQLADNAFPSMQLLLFVMEYLMDEPAVAQFVQQSLSPDTNDSDKFIRVLYDIAIGQDTAGKTQAVIEMTYLTQSRNPFVRIGALYMLSDPYYFPDPKFVEGMSGVLARDYPGLALTEEAVRLTLYANRQADVDILERAVTSQPETLEKSAASGEVSTTPEAAAISRIKNNDLLVACVKQALPEMAADRTRGVETLCQDAVNAPDWRTRYGCLLMAEAARDTAASPALKAACITLAKRPDPTPDVARARVLSGNQFRADYKPDQGNGPLNEAVQTTKQLLQTQWDAYPFERNLYEECLKETQNMAEWMAQHGYKDQATQLHQALIAKYPQSIVAKASSAKQADLGGQ